MISVSMDGVSDAVETFRDLIVPWRRKNSEKKAKLDNAYRQAEIHRINAENLIAHARAEREKSASQVDEAQAELVRSQAKKTEAEASLLFAQADKTRAEAEKELAQLRQSQIELAMKIVDRYAPHSSDVQRMQYVMSLVSVIEKLTITTIDTG